MAEKIRLEDRECPLSSTLGLVGEWWTLLILHDALDALRGDPDEERARQSALIPLRRYGEPDEFGRAAAFLLSAAASFITGAMIPVDGGAIASI
jgi:NAD(P)-dependent dehydrogenase (short-subunit alcohol dehydrogenase family)